MFAFLFDLFDTSGFPARWHCGIWSAQLGWLHIVSDVAVFGAYTAIPVVLAFFVLRKPDVPFPRIFWLFVAFIFACGFGHLVEAIIFWEPVYRFAGVVKAFTAVVSWLTVIALVVIMPQALQLPGLAKLNAELRNEVDERRRVEGALRASEDKLAKLLDSERNARGDAERANRIKDEFLSTVSHELRTPLHAILGYTQLLMHGEVHGEQREGLTIIERNAKAQSQIIDDLLDRSWILAGKVRLDVKTVDMVAVVEAALTTVRPAADAKNIRIQTVLDPHAGPVRGDSGRLEQVLWNLISNAIKFTPRDGRIHVTVQCVDSQLELRVSDNGQGIAAEFLPYVFDRFRQADGGTTRKHGGLGLGLSIVKHLVELHGGTIAAESPGSGQGATFVIRLPAQIVQHDRRSASPADHRHLDGTLAEHICLTGIRALVVDDESDGRELIKQLLERHGAEVQTATSAREAVEAIKLRTPHILVSDIGMPDMDGYELMQHVRSLPGPAGMLPAAAMTALARSQDRTRALFAGYHAHIPKPVEPAELIAVVATLTGRTALPGGSPIEPMAMPS